MTARSDVDIADRTTALAVRPPVSLDVPGPMVPSIRVRSDRILPTLIAASLAVHIAVVLPSLLGWPVSDPATPPPREVTVDLVQLPPRPAKKPEPKPAAKPSPKVVQQKAAAKQEARREPPKPPQKAPEPKPASKPQSKPQVEQQQPRHPSVAERMKQLLGPMPPGMEARALPGTSAFGTENASYTQLVLSQVAKAKKEGTFHGLPGSATVSFVVGDGGELASVELARPSGDAALDDEAIAMIRRAAPFPPPPPGGRRDYTVTLVFKLT